MTKLTKPEDAPTAFQAAWNAHDMSALGSLFDEDATFVNRFGHYVRGIDEIVALHVPIHKTIYSDSTLENELIDVVHIADGVVDARSISDIQPEDLREFTQCHFFAGIGVWSYALRLAQWPDSRQVWTGSCPCPR